MADNRTLLMPNRFMRLGDFEPDFDDISTFTTYKKIFYFQGAPTPDMMLRAQKESILDLRLMESGEWGYYKYFNNDYNGNEDKNNAIDQMNFSQIITDTIQHVEENFLDLRKHYSLNSNAIDTEVANYRIKLNQLINDYRAIVDKYSETTEGMVGQAIQRLKSNIIILENEINSASPLGLQHLKTDTGASLIRSLAGISSAIVGVELELKGVDFVIKHKPAGKTKQTQVFQLGDVMVSVDGNGGWRSVDIKEDIGVFVIDKATRAIQIELSDGSFRSLGELMDNNFASKDNKRLILSKQGYLSLQKAMLLGISAKVGRSKTFSLHTGLTIGRLQEWLTNTKDPLIWALYHWNQLYTQRNGDYDVPAKTLSATFNYAMSHTIPNIIGNKNKVFLTRRGFETSYEFLNKVLQNGQRVTAHGVHLGQGARVTVPNI